MSAYERFAVQIRRVEFHVPAPPPWGACWNEVSKAIHVASRELVDAGQLDEAAEPPADLIRVTPGDDEVIVSYEVRTSTRVPLNLNGPRCHHGVLMVSTCGSCRRLAVDHEAAR